MTREEILSMQPGRELDLLVAEKVMGWEFGEDFIELSGGLNRGGKWFNPSSDIAAAWEVVEKLQESHLYTDIRTCADFYEVWITIHEDGTQTETFASPKLPEAICKAALLAVMNL